MEAIIATGGKQYQVTKGQKLTIEKIDAEVGSEIEFDCLAILDDEPKFGQPLLKGVKVTGKIIAQDRGDKIVVSKYKRRKGYHKKQGHRQSLTNVEIADIKA